MKSQNKTNITFILPTLVAGGAERVVSFVAQNINPEKFNSTLLVTGSEKDAAYLVKNINLIFLEKKRVKNATFELFVYLIKNKPNVVLSSIEHLNTVMGLMAPFFPKTKFIVREASVISTMNDIQASNEPVRISSKLRSIMAFLSYKFIDNIICQSQDMAEDFVNIYRVPVQKIVIINNPITQNFILRKTLKKTDNIVKFITVGRLSKEKGHFRILKLLSQLKFKFHYTIVGQGPLKEEIFKMIKLYNLSDKITHVPFTKNVSKYLSLNDLYLQGSYVEGFPNTVLESCFVGTPVLAFNVPGGTKEIIIHEKNGYLVETEEMYLFYLNNRLNLSPADIRTTVANKFDKNKIIAQYEALFK